MEKALDDDEPDGEAASFEFTPKGLEHYNIYQKDIRSQKVMKKVPIGEIFRNEPNHVNDHWNRYPMISGFSCSRMMTFFDRFRCTYKQVT